MKINKGRSVDNDDEVDDIELILSSDDKEYPQEDLVSISYYEPWQLCGQTGTPVLVNYNNISSDNENAVDESQEKLSLSPINHDQFYNAIKENVAQQQLSLESSDSLSLVENMRRGYDFNSKSMSLEKDPDAKASVENGLFRDESFDTFQPVRFCTFAKDCFTLYPFNLSKEFVLIFSLFDLLLAVWLSVDYWETLDKL